MRELNAQNYMRRTTDSLLLGIVEHNISILSIICTSHYEADLIKAAFLLAFNGFFRVGELTVGPKGDQIHTVKIENVKLFSNHFETFLVSSKNRSNWYRYYY